jgi:hypothetical protein
MEATFLEEEGRANTATHAVFCGATLRTIWVTRRRIELFKAIIAEGGDPHTLDYKLRVDIENNLRAEAINKFPLNNDYRVRIVEDDLLTPVSIIGEEASVIVSKK